MIPTPKDALYLANEVMVFTIDAMTDPNCPEVILDAGRHYESILRDYAERLRA